jgi:hypothetical protein
MSKPKWQGEKSGGSHTTLIEVAGPLIGAAEKMPEVKKISLGHITVTRGSRGKRGMKFAPLRGGLKVRVRGNTSVQEIWIYTDFPKEVQQQLEKIKL